MKKLNKNIEGFTLVMSILILLVMSLIGVTMITLIRGEFSENERRDNYQQTLYAAETAINLGKTWLKKSNLPELPINPSPWNGGGTSVSSWCSSSLFVELPPTTNNYVIHNADKVVDLNSIMQSTDIAEQEKFSSYELFWFVAYPSVWDGTKYVNNVKVVATSTQNANAKSGSIDESSSKVSQSSSTGYFYTIYACARKTPGFFEKASVVALDVLVKATQ